MALPVVHHNTSVAGSIAWDAFGIQLKGQGYNVPAGETPEKWVWWEYRGGAPAILDGPDLPPTLGDDDIVLLRNKDGIAFRVQSANVLDGELLVDGSILADAIAANQINATHILSADITTGALVSDDAIITTVSGGTITGTTVQTSSIDDQGIHLDTQGLRAYPPAGGAAFFEVDPAAGVVITSGTGTFDNATVKTKTDLSGTVNLTSGSTTTLASGTEPPGSAPGVGSSYATQQFDPLQDWSQRYGWVRGPGNYWYTATVTSNTLGIKIEKYDPLTGLFVSSVTTVAGTAQDPIEPVSLAYGGGYFWLLGIGATIKTYRLWRVNESTLAIDAYAGWTGNYGTRTPAMYYDSGATYPIMIAQSRTDTDKVRVSRYAWTGTTLGTPPSWEESVSTYAANLQGLYYGMGDWTSGSKRYVTCARGTGDIKVYQGSPLTAQGADQWPSGTTSNKVAVVWDAGAFKLLDVTGAFRTYTQMDMGYGINDDPLTKWVSTTYFREQGATDWETPQSQRAKIFLPKRSRLSVTGPTLPVSPGTNDPNQINVYVGVGLTDPGRTQMEKQAQPGVGVYTYTYASPLAAAPIPGVAVNPPPATNTFPEGTPAKIASTKKRSDGITPTVQIQGPTAIGGVPTTNIDGLIPPGSIMMWAGAAAPDGWALCNGGTKSRTVDKQLFDNIGTTYGVGDGSTTFNLPNFNGRMPYGQGTDIEGSATVRALGSTGGNLMINVGQLPVHNHPLGAVTTTINRRATAGTTGGVAMGAGVSQPDLAANVVGPTGNEGSGNKFLPPYLAINFIIKL